MVGGLVGQLCRPSGGTKGDTNCDESRSAKSKIQGPHQKSHTRIVVHVHINDKSGLILEFREKPNRNNIIKTINIRVLKITGPKIETHIAVFTKPPHDTNT